MIPCCACACALVVWHQSVPCRVSWWVVAAVLPLVGRQVPKRNSKSIGPFDRRQWGPWSCIHWKALKSPWHFLSFSVYRFHWRTCYSMRRNNVILLSMSCISVSLFQYPQISILKFTQFMLQSWQASGRTLRCRLPRFLEDQEPGDE